MGFLLDFFAGGPLRLKGLLWGAGALVAAMLTLALYALWLRAAYYQVEAERDLARAQIQVLAAAVETCSASVDQAKRTAEAAIAGTAALVAEAQRLAQPARHTVERIEKIIREPAPARPDGKPAGCDEAWDRIEQSAGRAP